MNASRGSWCVACLGSALLLVILDTNNARADAPPAAEPAKAGPRPTPEQLKSVLGRVPQVLEKADEQGGREDRDIDRPFRFLMRLSGGDRVKLLASVAKAQAKLGDREAAGRTLDQAIAAIEDSLDASDKADKAKAFIEIAEAQKAAGQEAEARSSLKQALRIARLIKPDPDMSFLPSRDDELMRNKAAILAQLAAALHRAGDRDESERAFRLAQDIEAEAATPRTKATVLVDIAKARHNAGDEAGSREAWRKALRLGVEQPDAFVRGRITGVVLLARIRAGAPDEALRMIGELPDAEQKTFASYVVADAIAHEDVKVDAEVAPRLKELFEVADLEQPLRKVKAYTALAEALARLGDFEGASQVVRRLDGPGVPPWRLHESQISVARVIAAEKLKVGDKKAAAEALRRCLDFLNTFTDENGLYHLAWQDIAGEMARAGDIASALRVSEKLGSRGPRVRAFTGISGALADAGDRDGARKYLERAMEILPTLPAALQWDAPLRGYRGIEDEAGMEPRYFALEDIAVAQAKLGDMAAATATTKSIGKSGSMDATSATNNAVEKIVRSRLSAGDFDGAAKTLELLPKDRVPFEFQVQHELIRDIARTRTDSGDPSGAVAWAETLPTIVERVAALEGVVAGITAFLSAEDVTPKPRP